MIRQWPKPLKVAAAVAVSLSTAILIAALYAFEPSAGSLFPKCIFHQLTGLNCPGCGLQRAIHALMHGQVAEAVRYNAILPVMAVFAATYAAVHTLRRRWPRLDQAITSGNAALLIVAIILAWWILRNILHI